MRLVNSVRILVTKLMHNLLDPVKIADGQGLANKTFELESSTLALIVELIVESLGDVGVHGIEVGQQAAATWRGAALWVLWQGCQVGVVIVESWPCYCW